MTKHTPGPWFVMGRFGEWPTACREVRAKYEDADGDSHDSHVATVEEHHHTREAMDRAHANARLIAASPDVTRTLHALLSALCRDGLGTRVGGAVNEAVVDARCAVVRAGYSDPYADA